jgi:hypothetical protein
MVNTMNTYPENDYRNYLMHWGKGNQSKNHKYASRKMGKNGKWIYTYIANTNGVGSSKSDSKGKEDSSDWNHSYYFKDGKWIDIKKQKSDEKPKKDRDSKIKEILMKPLNAVSKKVKLKKAKKSKKGIPSSARPTATVQDVEHRFKRFTNNTSKKIKLKSQNKKEKQITKNNTVIKSKKETLQRRNRAYAIQRQAIQGGS